MSLKALYTGIAAIAFGCSAPNGTFSKMLYSVYNLMNTEAVMEKSPTFY